MHQETIELCFGQWIGPFLLDRVLRRHHQEQFGQVEGLAADRDLTLPHRLEQGRLHLGRRPVDLIGKHEIMKHRPLVEAETAVLRTVDLGSGEIRGQQVRRELDAVEITFEP